MSDPGRSRTEIADEETTARLLAMVSSSHSVPAHRAARVKAVVHRQWQTANRQRAFRRRAVAASVLLTTAAALVLIIARVIVDEPLLPPGEQVAVVDRIEGSPRRTLEGQETGGLLLRDVVRTGEWIETDPHARAALLFTDGTSVRLDVDSRARVLSASVIELAAGAVYVDTSHESRRFEIRTAMATARDVGTQFEVRLLDVGLRLRVRSGVVELDDGTRTVSGRGGTEVTLSATGAISQPIATHGPAWDWTASVAPPLDIEGMTLAAFVERIARENGWSPQYAEPSLAREAAEIVLHGSVGGLSAREALDVAITSSGLHHRLDAGVLFVFRASRSAGER